MDDSVSTVTNEEPVGIEILDQQEQNGLDNVKTDISRIAASSESKPQRVEEDYSVVCETANDNYQQNNTNDITTPTASLANSKLIESRTVEGRMKAGDGNDMDAGGDGSQDYLLPQGKEYWYCYHCC